MWMKSGPRPVKGDDGRPEKKPDQRGTTPYTTTFFRRIRWPGWLNVPIAHPNLEAVADTGGPLDDQSDKFVLIVVVFEFGSGRIL